MMNAAERIALNAGQGFKVPERFLATEKTTRVWPSRRIEATAIRLFDILFSLGVGLFILPTLLVIAAAIFIYDGGPVFEADLRIGRAGKVFKGLKFRTHGLVSAHSSEVYNTQRPVRTKQGYRLYSYGTQPRLTVIGQCLARTRVDGFPLLFNILTGEMSFVGPKSLRPDEREAYGESFRYYAQVKPGLTGLWQVLESNHCTHRRRAAIDRLFVARRSVWLYLRILVMAFPLVLIQPDVGD